MSTHETSLYNKYRPATLKEVVGQEAAIASLKAMITRKELKHALLFVGPSGCGKTTLARIIARKMGCVGDDMCEINAANFRGIDTVRDIQSRMSLSPVYGHSRVWIIDEAHKMSSDAQTALLKPLEEPPSHVYFILATTDPQKLLKTLVTRCTEIRVKSVTNEAIKALLTRVCEAEKIELDEEVADKIAECAQGSARSALVLLDKVRGIESRDTQLEEISESAASKEAISLARALLNGATFGELMKLVKEIKEEPESLRWMVLGYAQAVAQNGGKMVPNALKMMHCFQFNYYDTKKAGLIMSCYNYTSMK